MSSKNTAQSIMPNAEPAVPIHEPVSDSHSLSNQHLNDTKQPDPVPITTKFGSCPRCRAGEFTGICFECGYNTGRDLSIQQHASSMPPQAHSTEFSSSPIVTIASKCPRCGTEGFTGQCFKCGYNTGIGLSNLKSSSDSLPQSCTGEACCSAATKTARTGPRCRAGGFTGQCYECGYNTGVFLRVKS